MKLYGLLERLTKLKLFNSQEVSVEPNAQTGSAKTITIPDMSPASQAVVLADQAQTLSNKTIDADQNTITNIENADIKVGAAIDKAKISGTALTAADVGTVTSTIIANETIVNADIALNAAIAGTKISPDFGSQTIQTTGNITTSGTITANGVGSKLYVDVNSPAAAVEIRQVGTGNALSVLDDASGPGGTDSTMTFIDAVGNVGIGLSPVSTLTNKLEVGGNVKVTTGDILLDSAKGLESHTASSILNIGTTTNTSTINIGTGAGVQTVHIGTGSGQTEINIGASTDNVNITGNLTVAGTTTTVNSTNLDVADKSITLNKGGTTGFAEGAGLLVEGTGGASLATFQYDSILTSKFKLGASGSEAEVVTVSGTQTLSNKTVGTVTAESGTLSITGTGALKVPVGTTGERPVGSVSGMVRYNSTTSAFEGYDGVAWAGLGGGGSIVRVAQANTYTVADIGRPLYLNGANYDLAIATAANTAEVAGVLSKVIDASTFEICLGGEVTAVGANLVEGGGALTPGETYFLSTVTAGKITATEPSVVGHISKPVGIARSATALDFFNMRGTVVGAANARTTISVANAAATNVVNVTNYNSLKLEGELFVSRSSGNQRAYYTVEAAKNGAGTWQVSASYTGDDILYTTLPSWDVSGTQLQVTMPTVTNFNSASLTYSLNAPAVGASLPLSVDSTALNIVASAPLSYRNAIINGDMRIAQRGTSTTSATSAYVYSLDRWRFYGQNITGSATVSQQGFTAGQTDVPGEPEFFLRWNQTATPGGVVGMTQPVEGVRTFAGQDATLSFWAKAGSARSITARLSQNFGTGGSSAVTVLSSALSLTTVWQKFTVTFSVPSISGKTIGANNYLDVQFIDSNVSTFTIDIAQVQLEVGSKASAFERRPIQQELALCQRYYERWQAVDAYAFLAVGAGASTTSLSFAYPFKVSKRSSNYTFSTGGSFVNFVGPGTLSGFFVQGDGKSTETGAFSAGGTGFTVGAVYFLRANNSTSAFVAFDAEL
jgi:hypothetical protein